MTKEKRYPIHMRPIESNKHFITIGAIILWLYLRLLMKLYAEQNYVWHISQFFMQIQNSQLRSMTHHRGWPHPQCQHDLHIGTQNFSLSSMLVHHIGQFKPCYYLNWKRVFPNILNVCVDVHNCMCTFKKGVNYYKTTKSYTIMQTS